MTNSQNFHGKFEKAMECFVNDIKAYFQRLLPLFFIHQSFIAMSLLSRYVKKNALLSITAAVLGLWLLQTLFAYLAELENLTDSYQITDALRYIFYKSPYFLEQFIPTGALLGAVVGLGLLANNSEIVVMRASGVSSFKIVSWVMQPALIFVLIALMINQFVLPTSNHMAQMVSSGHTDNNMTSVTGYWTIQPTQATSGNATGQDVLFIDYADSDGNIGLVKRWHFDATGNLLSATLARGGHYIGSRPAQFTKPSPPSDGSPRLQHQWQLSDVSQINIGMAVNQSSVDKSNVNQSNVDKRNNAFESNKNRDVLTLPIEPKSVYLLTRNPDDLSLTQLLAHRTFMDSQQKRSLRHELAFWQKLLSPLSILALVLVACSFVFGSLRQHSLGLRIVMALLFGLLFSYLQDLVGYVALATGVSPLLMVLMPIVAISVLGMYLLERQR